MMVSTEKRIAFLAITKTATQSIFTVLEDHYDGFLLEKSDPHATTLPDVAHRCFKFTVVRNPYDRAVSLWWSTTQRLNADRYGFRRRCPDPDDFTRFCEWMATDPPDHPLAYPQSRWLDLKPDMILSFENLEEDFRKLPFYNGQPTVWPHANQTRDSRRDWPHYVTLEAVRWINQWYAEDFDRLDYRRLEAN